MGVPQRAFINFMLDKRIIGCPGAEPVVGMSWITLKLGVMPAMALMTFFGIYLIQLARCRRRFGDQG